MNAATDRSGRWRDASSPADLLLSVAVGGVQLLLLGISAQEPAVSGTVRDVTVLLIVCQAAPLVVRCRWPVPVFCAVLVPNTIYYAMGFPPSGLDLALAVALYTVAARCRRRVSMGMCGLLLVTFTLLWLLQVGPYWSRATMALFIYLLVFFSAAWAWGRYHRTKQHVRDAYVADLLSQAETSRRDREAEHDRAISDERRRIARELHDSVAHHISVMVVQAGAARRVLDSDPRTTKDALAAIEDAGRRGLDTMPSLIHALRGSEQSSSLTPQPVLSDAGQLIEQVNAAGLDATFTMEGPERPLPPGVELSAYRVIQEGLTNCLKHAAGASVAVTVRRGDERLVVSIVDNGGRETAPSPISGGHGLVGMRERVTLFGGTLRAAPDRTGGFAVVASFPTAE